ncbi:MAG: ATP-binding protein, partial [Bacteroidales bacterium]|nr:ATP-binding protein [Bacteroidales bacterium]
KVITGVRRCGKSTLLRMFADELLQDGVLSEQVQFYNFESRATRAIGSWKDIYNHIKDRLMPEKMNYIFLDEVHLVDIFHCLVGRLFIKKNVDLYVVGSNAYFLSDKFASLFARRYFEIAVLPLQFSEYHDFIAPETSNMPKTASLENYLIEGGVPEYFNRKNIGQKEADEFMRGVLSTLIKKDIFTLLKIKKKRKNRRNFNKMIYCIFDSIGSFSLPNTISNTLHAIGMPMSKTVIARYLDALCDMFLLYRVPHIEIRSNEVLHTFHKYYFVDPCFRKVCFLRQNMQYDITYWLENMVYFELLRRNRDVRVGLIDNKEIDFVATDHSGYTSYYQVSWSTMNKEVLVRELAPLKLVKNSNPKYLLTMDTDSNPVYDNDIRKLNIVDWLLEK